MKIVKMSGISNRFYSNCENGESDNKNDSSLNLSAISGLSANIDSFLNGEDITEKLENLNFSDIPIPSDMDLSVD